MNKFILTILLLIIGCSETPKNAEVGNNKTQTLELVSPKDLEPFQKTEKYFEKIQKEFSNLKSEKEMSDKVEDLKLNYENAQNSYIKVLESKIISSTNSKEEKLFQLFLLEKVKMEILSLNRKLIEKL